MTQAELWNKLNNQGITSIVGAGGKTTVLRKLVEYGLFAAKPMVATTTTHMLDTQVNQWKPYYGHSFSDAESHCYRAIAAGRCGAWFADVTDKKVDSVSPQDVDAMHRLHPNWHILVEADGAKTKWIKAPKSTEPVVPSQTATTIGVVNLQALGVPMEEERVHNMDLVMKLLEREQGNVLTPDLLAKLILHEHGVFQYSCGKKILFFTGYDLADPLLVDRMLDALTETDIWQIYLAEGFRETCEIKKVFQWR